jgi:hypothetical protein
MISCIASSIIVCAIVVPVDVDNEPELTWVALLFLKGKREWDTFVFLVCRSRGIGW